MPRQRPRRPPPTLNSDGPILNASALSTRRLWSQLLGKTFGGDRDIYAACGWTKSPSDGEYLERFQRQDIAERVVSAYPDATWRRHPDIREDDDQENTVFEEAWLDVARDELVWHYLNRVDTMAGVGQYALLLLGFKDGKPLSSECTNGGELMYMQPYYQSSTEIKSWDSDTASDRYGMPVLYRITPYAPQVGSNSAVALSRAAFDVHYTRVIHVAEGCMESDVYGKSRLQTVLNRLQDIEKILGGSSEAYWKAGFPGHAIIKDAEADWGDTEEEMEEEVDNYYHNLSRYMRLSGVDVKEIGGSPADPTNAWNIQIAAIAAASEIPTRILLGSERGELASGQDAKEWLSRVDERRRTFAGPMILRPFVQRLIDVKILPEPAQWEIVWPDVDMLTEKDKADIAKTKAEAIAAYAKAPGAEMVYPPEYFLTDILGIPQKRVDEMRDAIEEQMAEAEADAAAVAEAEAAQQAEDEAARQQAEARNV